MKTFPILVLVLLAAACGLAGAAELPHKHLVEKYLKSGQAPTALPDCRRDPVSAPREAGPQQECWAAFTASGLAQEPLPIRAFALDTAAREATLKRCKAYSYKELMERADCRAAARAATMVSLRLPSLRAGGLKPLSPEDFKRAPGQ